VQGRYLLAKALDGLGDRAGADRARADAWREYVALPRFKRPEERPYAWRIRPGRPIAIACAVLAVAAVVALAVAQAPAPPPRGEYRELQQE
jgi:hypothetical protein